MKNHAKFGYFEQAPFEFRKVTIEPVSVSREGVIDVRTLSFSICGSDYIYSTSPEFRPRAIGHEWLGITSKKSLVTSEAFWGCGKCKWCQRHLDRCCREKEIFGSGGKGASLLRLHVPSRNLAKISPMLSEKFGQWQLTLLEPIAVCFSAFEDLRNLTSNFEGCNRVLVTGAGFLGLTMAQLLMSRGMECRFLEASKARMSNINYLGFRLTKSNETNFDIAIDAAGERPIRNNTAFAASIRRTRRCGIVLGLGKYVNPAVTSSDDLQNRGISVICPRGAKEGMLSRLSEKPPSELFSILSFFSAHSNRLFDWIEFLHLPGFYRADNQLPTAIRTIVNVSNEREN